MTLTLHSPELVLGAALAVLVPLLAAMLEKRKRRRSGLLPYDEKRFWSRLPGPAETVWLGLTFAIIALAVARPAVAVEDVRTVYECAEVVVLVDNSKSELAAPAPNAPTRFERQQGLALTLRHAFPDCTWGLGSFTANATLRIPTKASLERFHAVLTRVIEIDEPPPKLQCRTEGCRTTTFDAFADVVTNHFFSSAKEGRQRILVVFTDGESAEFGLDRTARLLKQARIELLLVHVWEEDEYVFDENGEPFPDYEADPQSRVHMQELVDAMNELPGETSAALFDEQEAARIIATLHELIGEKEVIGEVVETSRIVNLGPYVAATAVFPAILFFSSLFHARLPRRRLRRREE